MRHKKIGEIILYQPNNLLKLEVRLEDETVWLTQAQIADLFSTKRPAITKHLSNIFHSGELIENSVCSILEHTANDGKIYQTKFYNLDAILSVGYRVNSINATLFRIWATRTLKEYLLKGYAINQRVERLEYRMTETAKKSIILIDNYIDESVLILLSKRTNGVDATIYTSQISSQLRLDLQKHNAQYPSINIQIFQRSHDRFLFIDSDVYHIGASLKDFGKKWFAFSKIRLDAKKLISNII
ncbi:MAG: virulence RhuM family protein [Prevotellaceae bacterium]|jgi:hypothetical protein|nr:virulence RhuM family protein [Prevotellaceae bacterium]